ncbi:hypothetical protein V6Z12_D11G157800 [Gossypium hirsutum]
MLSASQGDANGKGEAGKVSFGVTLASVLEGAAMGCDGMVFGLRAGSKP